MKKKSIAEKLSIIIINYNSTTYLNRLIASIKNITDIVEEVIIIDNHSQDLGSLVKKENYFKFFLIKNNHNVGFSKAVNQGIKATRNNLILLLNPDSYIPRNSNINYLFERIHSDNRIGAIGGKIISQNQKYTANMKPGFFVGLFEFTILKRLFPNNPFSMYFWPEKSKKIKDDIEVDSLCGAFLIFRKIFQNQFNLFDENYFLYLEDLDFCLKLRRQNQKVIFSPNSKIYHKGGVSSRNIYNITQKYWYNSRKYFFKKHLKKIEALVLNIIFSIEELIFKIL